MQSQNVTSEISALSFSLQEDEVYAGSSRGAINVWDINSQKRNSPWQTE